MSNIAHSVDQAFIFITIVSVILLALVTFFMLYFAWRYRSSANPEVEEVEGHLWLEIFWTVLPTILVMIMFWVGYKGFVLMRQVPDDAMRIKVTGQMWTWGFEYENGKKEDVLYVPRGKPVALLLTSKDVLHSLFIPAFRVKEDVVPGLTTQLWFIAEENGEYNLFCTEYCGVGHSGMITKVLVMEPEEFNKWYMKKPLSEAGPALLKAKRCLGCHSLDGSKKVGPTFKGLFGRAGILETDGKEQKYVVDKAYIRRSIKEPKAEVVKGFRPIMPTIEMTGDELDDIVRFLMRGEFLLKPSGDMLLKEKKCLGCHTLDGSKKVGPTFKGLFGRKGILDIDGTEREYVVDEAYIMRSIKEPKSEVVKGFRPIMPTIEMTESELDAIVEFLKENN